jgi:hypothetical protein
MSCEQPANSSASVFVPVGRERVRLVDPHSRERLALLGELIAQSGELLLALEQRPANHEPFLTCPDRRPS